MLDRRNGVIRGRVKGVKRPYENEKGYTSYDYNNESCIKAALVQNPSINITFAKASEADAEND